MACLGVSLCLLISPFCVWAQSSPAREYRAKANFLATSPIFIDWPKEAFPSAESPFLVCVFGYYSFGISLVEATRTASIHGRRVEVSWIHRVEELRTCHLLFVSGSERKRYDKILEAVRGTNVLTVGETPDFLDAGGAISLTYEEPMVRFEVSVAAANGAHVRISSKLLVLARRVIDENKSAMT